jgi:hypothetical protein
MTLFSLLLRFSVSTIGMMQSYQAYQARLFSRRVESAGRETF